jgi:hypothetical protein
MRITLCVQSNRKVELGCGLHSTFSESIAYWTQSRTGGLLDCTPCYNCHKATTRSNVAAVAALARPCP